MRILHYKYINSLVLFLCAMLFVACSGDDDTTIVTGKAIGFECQTEEAKGVKTTTADMQYFRVSAIWAKGGNDYQSFMSNQLVERDGANWVYSPILYWPSDGSVSFFAYSPAISSGLKSFNISNTDNKVSIGYEVPTDGEDQEDFLVATALEKTDNPVHLQFEHALATVEFYAKTTDTNTSYRINRITMNNLSNTATLTGTSVSSSSVWAWSGFSSPTTNYDVYQKYAFEVPVIYKEVGSLMVLPQITGSSFKIEIACSANDTDKTASYTLSSGFEFEMGKKYSFYIDMDGTALSGLQGRNRNYPVNIKYSIDDVFIE